MTAKQATIEIRIRREHWLTSNQRMHWAKKAKITAHLRSAGAWHSLATTERFTRARIVVNVGWPDKRRRDVANFHPTIKALIDGMVDAEVLPDDDDKHLVGPDLRAYVAGEKGVAVLRFEIEEAGEWAT